MGASNKFLKSPDAYEILHRYHDIQFEISGGSTLVMDKKDMNISRGFVSGYESGLYEPAKNYDRAEFRSHTFEDPMRRDNRISIRVSAKDLEQLHKISLEEGIPSQSLIASIVHKYVNGLLLDIPAAANHTVQQKIKQL